MLAVLNFLKVPLVEMPASIFVFANAAIGWNAKAAADVHGQHVKSSVDVLGQSLKAGMLNLGLSLGLSLVLPVVVYLLLQKYLG